MTQVTLYDDDALNLMQGWWSSQGDPLYAIYSMGGQHEAEVFQDAISNLNSEISRVKKVGRNKFQLGKGTFSKKEIDELYTIRDALQMSLDDAGIHGDETDLSEARKKRAGTPVRYKNDLFEVFGWDGYWKTKDMMPGHVGGKEKAVFWTHGEAQAFANGFMQRHRPQSKDAQVRISDTKRSGDTTWHELWKSSDGSTWTFAGTGRYAGGNLSESQNHTNDRLFIGVYSTGISYADRKREKHGDYAKCAFLDFDTLTLKFYPDCPASLRKEIEQHAATIQARRGEQYPIDASGHTVTLGGRQAKGVREGGGIEDWMIASWNNGDAYRDGALQNLADNGFVAYGRKGWEPTSAGIEAGLRASNEPNFASESRVVADFNTLEDLVAHAGRELGATHVVFNGDKTQAWIYFPRGGEYPYEEARTWRKGGYWHAEGPGSREGVKRIPNGAKPIEGRRHAAEARTGRRGRKSAAAYDFLRWMSGWTISQDVGDGWLVAYKMSAVQGETPGEQICFLRQAPRIWHAFYRERATGSGTTPGTALSGGLGDVIGDDREMRAYCRAVLKAPRELVTQFDGLYEAQSQCRNEEGMSEARHEPVEDPFYIIQPLWSDGTIVGGLGGGGGESFGFDDEDVAVREAKKLLRDPTFEGDYVQVITRDGELVWDSQSTSEAREDYIAVDRNDRRAAGPFPHRHQADSHVPPGGHVKFVPKHRRGAPPAPSSYPLFREGSRSGSDTWVPPELARDGITPTMLNVLLYGMGEHAGGAKVPMQGDSVVYDRAYSALRENGYIVLKRKTEGLSSFGDYFVLTDKGAGALNRYRVAIRKLSGGSVREEGDQYGVEPVPPEARAQALEFAIAHYRRHRENGTPPKKAYQKTWTELQRAAYGTRSQFGHFIRYAHQIGEIVHEAQEKVDAEMASRKPSRGRVRSSPKAPRRRTKKAVRRPTQRRTRSKKKSKK